VNRSSDVGGVARALGAAARRLDELRRAARAPGEAHESASSSTFLRGLVVGALVGAAIAGSTIWERRRSRRKAPDTAA
jgi:hypothetical protein